MLQNDSDFHVKLTVVFDNVLFEKNLTASWGFACVVQTGSDTLLFDTGNSGKILLANMQKLNFDPGLVQSVVISHNHWDHQDGLPDFLAVNPNVTVFIPHSSPVELEQSLISQGAVVRRIDSFQPINSTCYSLGELKENFPEQSLAVRSPQGLIVITGCAHPGIVPIVERAVTLFPEESIYLVMGGFHLKGDSERTIEEIGRKMQNLGVQKFAPSHCTGESAMKIFQQQFQQDYIQSGVGRVILVP